MKSLITAILEDKLSEAKDILFTELDEKAKSLIEGYKKAALESMFEAKKKDEESDDDDKDKDDDKEKDDKESDSSDSEDEE